MLMFFSFVSSHPIIYGNERIVPSDDNYDYILNYLNRNILYSCRIIFHPNQQYNNLH